MKIDIRLCTVVLEVRICYTTKSAHLKLPVSSTTHSIMTTMVQLILKYFTDFSCVNICSTTDPFGNVCYMKYILFKLTRQSQLNIPNVLKLPTEHTWVLQLLAAQDLTPLRVSLENSQTCSAEEAVTNTSFETRWSHITLKRINNSVLGMAG